jgi:uncharacterized membrane protein YgcG
LIATGLDQYPIHWQDEITNAVISFGLNKIRFIFSMEPIMSKAIEEQLQKKSLTTINHRGYWGYSEISQLEKEKVVGAGDGGGDGGGCGCGSAGGNSDGCGCCGIGEGDGDGPDTGESSTGTGDLEPLMYWAAPNTSA